MGIDKDFLREIYKQMPDAELLSVLSNDFNDLTPEAQELFKTELNSRGLGDGLAAVAQMGETDEGNELYVEYFQKIQALPCPYCSASNGKLNAAMVKNGRYDDYIIGCPECLRKKLEDAQATSMGMGLIGGVGGVVKAVKQTNEYERFRKQVISGEPTEALKNFIKKRIGELVLYKDDPEKLASLIEHPNAISF